MNYFLSVVPYLGAVEAGMAPRVVLKENPDSKVSISRMIRAYCDGEQLFLSCFDPAVL